MAEPHIAGRVLIAAASVILVVSACSDGGGDRPAASDSYQQAVEQLPADTSTFMFSDIETAERHLGIENEHDPETYIDAVPESGWAPTSSLMPYLDLMSDSAWDPTDIVWEAQGGVPPTNITVRRLDDSVDLDAAIDELKAAGYTATSEGDGTRLSAGMDDVAASDGAGLYVQLGLSVLVLPDDGLIVSAPNPDALATYTEMDETLADAGTFDGLVDGESLDIEYVYAQSDPRACDPGLALPDSQVNAELSEKLLQPYEDLGTPDASTLSLGIVDDEPAADARLRFADEAAAQADAEPREALTTEGTSLVSATPYSEYFSVDDISVNGAIETVAIDPLGEPGRLQQMVVQRDAPFLACGPS